ncbi:ABC transporter permease [Nocardioides endophyticus]|uniref:ABC transporter permease n=1 Tax=Nocardioides endophyticus TaxID=1353775 RepID=A0ABP8Z0L6_9ACTN
MRVVRSLAATNSTFIGLVILIIVFGSLNSRFLTSANAENIVLSVTELAILTAPLALLVISGSVDLSVGSIASVGGVTMGMVMSDTGSLTLGILAGLGFGVVAGAINGGLVAYAGLNPIVVTLGFLAVWGGIAMYLTEGATLFEFPGSFESLGSYRLFGIFPVALLVAVVVIGVSWWILHASRFGKYLYSIGGNERAAFLMGVSVKRVRLAMFVAVGLTSAIAGMLLAVKLGAAAPQAGRGVEIQALTVVLLGGVAFAGGAGRMTGVIAGLLFVGVLQNGLVVVGTSQFLQQFFIGAALLVGIAINDSMGRLVRRGPASPGRDLVDVVHDADTGTAPDGDGQPGPVSRSGEEGLRSAGQHDYEGSGQ